MAMVMIRQQRQQPGQLVLVIGAPGAVIDFLQQDDIGIFLPQHPGHFADGAGDIFPGRAAVRALLAGHIVKEDIVFPGHVLHVVAQHLQQLPRLEQRCLPPANNCLRLLRFGMEGKCPDHCSQ